MSANDVPNTPPKKRPSPPKEFQFKKGVSGNPNGRPPKKRPAPTGVANAGEFAFHDSSFLSVTQQEQNRLMSVKEGDRSEMMPALQAAIRRMGVEGEVQQASEIDSTIRSLQGRSPNRMSRLLRP